MSTTSNNDIPFFSVIICTYNRSPIILRAIQSLLKQTCTDWECIIIDDASTDDTKEKLSPFLSEKIHYFYRPHQGAAFSKNEGIEVAKGHYITFLDSDDAYLPEHLAIRKEILQKSSEIDLLHSNVLVIGNKFVPDKNNAKIMIPIEECIIGGTFFLKRQSLDTDDRFKNVFSEESVLLNQFISKKRKVHKINSPTYVYHRDTDESICNKIQQEHQ